VLGISQLELSHLSRVSLATIQNLEAGRANPSLRILAPILRALGLELDLVETNADWDLLIDHGLPLSKHGSGEQAPTAVSLLQHLRLAARDVDRGRITAGAERKRESLDALLLALKTSFPSRYRKWFGRSPLFERLTPKRPSGRVIKLKRIAEARLGEYL
jgi:transcriptional regulator with XRE-family HTH domain